MEYPLNRGLSTHSTDGYEPKRMEARAILVMAVTRFGDVDPSAIGRVFQLPSAEKITVKIAGLGNGESVRSMNVNELLFLVFFSLSATWVEHHFTDDIQTRQHQCPEVIHGVRWDPSLNLWSVACIVSFSPHTYPGLIFH